MSLHTLVWKGLRVAKKCIVRSGVADLRVGGFSVREAGRALARFAIFKCVRPLSQRPLLIQGHKMYLGGGPSVLFSLDLAADRYEPATTQLFKRLLREGMAVIDVGAHVGYFTLLAAKLVGPQGKVYAFEAEPSTYRTLATNVKLNHYSNVVAVNQAVSDRAGRVDLFLSNVGSDGASGLNRLYSAQERERSVSVESTTLDDFLAAQRGPQVDLLKMDIDGWELHALDGMARLLRRPSPPNLIIEFYPDGLQSCGTDPLDLPRRLAELGFTCSIIAEDLMDKVSTPEELLGGAHAGGSVNLFCEHKRG